MWSRDDERAVHPLRTCAWSVRPSWSGALTTTPSEYNGQSVLKNVSAGKRWRRTVRRPTQCALR
eukprot:8913858-Pyramimonas_sp.AAC.1